MELVVGRRGECGIIWFGKAPVRGTAGAGKARLFSLIMTQIYAMFVGKRPSEADGLSLIALTNLLVLDGIQEKR